MKKNSTEQKAKASRSNKENHTPENPSDEHNAKESRENKQEAFSMRNDFYEKKVQHLDGPGGNYRGL